MIKPDYWNIKPHTERKLEILEKYLNAWCDIIFNCFQKNPSWTAWKTPFFVDCFSGRGMYHKNGKLDSIKGSPIVAIEKFICKKQAFEEKFNKKIYPKCRFIEYNSEYSEELNDFISTYKKYIDIKVLNGDFNNLISGIVKETGYSPTFFFVDAGGIKELKKESVEKIVTKKGARDILLNYVVYGQIRIGGLAHSVFDGNYKGNQLVSAFKSIERLEDFTGMEIVKFLDETHNDYKEALISYVNNVLHANNKVKQKKDRLHTIIYDMKDTKRQKLVYYLLFSSRKTVATDIMKNIFKQSKKKELNQGLLFDPEILELK